MRRGPTIPGSTHFVLRLLHLSQDIGALLLAAFWMADILARTLSVARRPVAEQWVSWATCEQRRFWDDGRQLQ